MILGLTGFVNSPNVSSFTWTESNVTFFFSNHMASSQADSAVFNIRLPERNNKTWHTHYSLLQMTEKHASDNLFQLDCV